MQRLLIALAALLFSVPAWADSLVHNLGTNATSPLPANSCLYVDQSSTTDAKLCSGWAAALGGLVAANNLSDLTNTTTSQNNLFGTPTQNKVYASPNGSTGNPTFRALVGADIPVPSASTLGGTESITCAAGQHINTISTSGVPACTADTGGTPPLFVGAMSGTNTITVASTTPTGFTLTDQFMFCGMSGGTNTGAVTLNVTSTGAISVNKETQGGLVALAGGEMTNSNQYCFQYQGAANKFVLITNAASSVSQAATSQTITAPQWANWQVFDIQAAGQTLTLPVATSLPTNGGIVIKVIGNSVTLQPNAADGINGGTAGASVTIPANQLPVILTTSGASGTTAFSAPLGFTAGTNITLTPNSNGTTQITSSGGGVGVKISTCALASTTCNFNSLGSHDYYHLLCSGVTTSTTADVEIQVNSDTTSGHYSNSGVYNSAATAQAFQNNTDSRVLLIGSAASTDVNSLNVWFDNIASTSLKKIFQFQTSTASGAGNQSVAAGAGAYLQSGTAITSVQFTTSTGTFGSGANKCTLYGFDS